MTNRRNDHFAPLFRALDEELRSRPYGAVREMERALDACSGWWYGRKRSGDITTRNFVAILGHLGLDPVNFIRRHLGSPDSLELDRPKGPPPSIAQVGWRRLCEEEESAGLGEQFFDRLDEQRYQEPDKALQMAQQAVELASLDELPRLLAIAGAALRAQIALADAEHCYYAAIQGAQLRGDQRAVGNFLRWYSNLLLNKGSLKEALRVADQGASLLLRENDTLGVAKSCVEQGNCLFCLERWTEATLAFQAALDRLPEEEALYRCAALQTSALAYKNLGNLEESLRCVKLANTYKEVLSAKHRAKLIWTHAEICGGLGHWKEEENLLWVVVDLLSHAHYGEAALATCDLVRNLIVQDRPIEAFEVARRTLALIEPLRHNRIISAAIADLLRVGKAGITLALVSKVRSKIESERRHGNHWSLLEAP